MTPDPTSFDTPGREDDLSRGLSSPPAADWVGVDPDLRSLLGSRLKPGERVLWVQQARLSFLRVFFLESPCTWLAGAIVFILAAEAWPVETTMRTDGGTALLLGGNPAFLWKDGDISAFGSGAVVGCVLFIAALLCLAWQAFKTIRLGKEVYAVTNRRFLYLHPFLLDLVVDAAPIHTVTLRNRVLENHHNADIFLSYPRSVTRDHTYGAPAEEVVEIVRMRGILSPESVARHFS